ncbi:rhomboid family intramembrane serine protease [Chondrinema litorale]|uniref:rhomboid family intramembrane serine protease n=1 Tax=Chondrinema litorale TaxID=2994555 RepID=UPI002543B366|nr:rhomboid family intramembrane serine protease [Chondrinema litorale]UZR94378.1 rhomboid family intramembrane serine protease [Chondrinema litorale]
MDIIKSIKIPAYIVASFWIVKFLEDITQIDLGFLGIYPRSVHGLIGLIFWPFIHGNYEHLISNTATFFILSASLLFFYPNIAYKVALYLFLITGIGVWLFARDAYHIGASGLIYGFASFLFFSGIFRKDNKAVIISLTVAFLYGGMIYGIFPMYPGVSYESHLIGLLAGIYCAHQFKDYIASGDEVEDDIIYYDNDLNNDLTEGYRNLESDSFKYTFKQKEQEVESDK